MNDLRKCTCGEIPELIKIGEWPAQYEVRCACGKCVRGAYYSHHEYDFRHRAAKKAAVKSWNAEEK